MYVKTSNGEHYIRALPGDSQEITIIRAARFSLSIGAGVYYQILNKGEYCFLNLSEAKLFMSPRMWVSELLGDGHWSRLGALKEKEKWYINSQKDLKNQILELLKEKKNYYRDLCLKIDEKIKLIAD